MFERMEGEGKMIIKDKKELNYLNVKETDLEDLKKVIVEGVRLSKDKLQLGFICRDFGLALLQREE